MDILTTAATMHEQINQLLKSIDALMDQIAPCKREAQYGFERNLHRFSRVELYQAFNKNLASRNFASATSNLRQLMSEADWDPWHYQREP